MIPQLEELGFSIWETGGGCQAFGRALSLDSYLYVTDEEGCDTPGEDDEMIGLGHYRWPADQCEILIDEILTVDAALIKIEEIIHGTQ